MSNMYAIAKPVLPLHPWTNPIVRERVQFGDYAKSGC